MAPVKSSVLYSFSVAAIWGEQHAAVLVCLVVCDSGFSSLVLVNCVALCNYIKALLCLRLRFIC